MEIEEDTLKILEEYNSFILNKIVPDYRNMLKNYHPNIDEVTLAQKEKEYFKDMPMFDTEGNVIMYYDYIHAFEEH